MYTNCTHGWTHAWMDTFSQRTYIAIYTYTRAHNLGCVLTSAYTSTHMRTQTHAHSTTKSESCHIKSPLAQKHSAKRPFYQWRHITYCTPVVGIGWIWSSQWPRPMVSLAITVHCSLNTLSEMLIVVLFRPSVDPDKLGQLLLNAFARNQEEEAIRLLEKGECIWSVSCAWSYQRLSTVTDIIALLWHNVIRRCLYNFIFRVSQSWTFRQFSNCQL